MEDAKALNQTSNFWNGLLEEDGNPLPVALDLDVLEQGRASTPKFDRSIGYCSDALSLYSKHLSGDDLNDKIETKSKSINNSQSLKYQTDVGRSHFKLLRTKNDQLLHLKLKSASVSTINPDTVTAVDPFLQIKVEPTNESTPHKIQTVFFDPSTPAIVSSTTDITKLQETIVIKQEQIVTSCDATASHDYAAPVPCVVSTATPTIFPMVVKTAARIRTASNNQSSGQIWQQPNTNNTQGMTTTTAITATGIRRQINGPHGKKKLFIYAKFE